MQVASVGGRDAAALSDKDLIDAIDGGPGADPVTPPLLFLR